MAIQGIYSHRKDTAANYSSNNPILKDGEIAIEGDTEKIKIGDGSTAWNDLDYAVFDPNNYYDSTYIDDNYYTETEVDNIYDGTYTLDDAYNSFGGTGTVDIDDGNLNWDITGDYSFKIEDSAQSDVKFLVDNENKSIEMFASVDITMEASDAVDFFATNKIEQLSSSLQLGAGPDNSTIESSIIFGSGEINFGDSRLGSINAITLSDDSNTSINSGASSIVGAINDAYNINSYDQSTVDTNTDDLTQQVATASGESITNPFTGTTFNP